METKEKLKIFLNSLKTNADKDFNKSIIFLTIALFVYCYFGSFSFFEKVFAVPNVGFYKIIYHNFMAFVIFFVGGLLFTKFAMKKSPKDFNLQAGNSKMGLVLVVIATAVIPLFALLAVQNAEMQSCYPLIDFNVFNARWQILLYFASYMAYYLGWEYLFRGLALNGTKNKIGILGAILFTTMISCLIHTSIGGFGKPMIETLSAIPAGLVFGYIAYKTNSIFPSLYMHALMGISIDMFLVVF